MTKKRQTTGLPKKPSEGKTPSPKPPATGTTPEQTPARPPLTTRLGLITPGAGEYKSRAERETEISRIVILATAAVMALVIIVIVAAVVVDGLIRPNEAVARVNDVNISASQFTQRARIERAILIEQINNRLNDVIEQFDTDIDTAGQFVLSSPPYSNWWSELNIPDQLGIRVLEDMINEQFIRAEAERLGVVVTEEDIDAKINDLIDFDPEAIAALGQEPTPTPEPTLTPTPFVSPTPSPAPTATPTADPAAVAEPDAEATAEVEAELEVQVTPQPTPTPQPTLTADEQIALFESRRERFLNNLARRSGLNAAQVREYIAYLALRDKLAEALDENQGQAIYADARHILVNTEAEALDVLDALNRGESFADLARALSQDPGSGANGGELGKNSILGYVEPFAEAIRTAQIGEIVGPVESEFGYHIIQVRSRELRDMTSFEISTNRTRTLSRWIDDVREAQAGNFEIFSNWVSFVPRNPQFVYEPR